MKNEPGRSEDTERVRTEFVRGVAHVRMVRVEKVNALDGRMFVALLAAAEKVKHTKGVRAVVLSGEGRGFCAGIDTAIFSTRIRPGSDGREDKSVRSMMLSARRANGANDVQQAVLAWHDLPIPVIAAVHGIAFGGGFQLALGADLRFITADARLSMMEVRWGLVPDMAGMALLGGLVRDDIARDLIYSGREIRGAEAEKLGLATRVCEDPCAEALSYAREIAQRNPHAIRAAKRLLILSRTAPRTRVLETETAEQLALSGSANQLEAIRASQERRLPKFDDVIE